MKLLPIYSRLPFVLLFIFLAVIFSCRKDGGGPPAPPKPTDTLATGWQKIAISNVPNFLSDIFFVNNNVGWLAGDKYIAKSVDGGLTWTRQTIADSPNIFNLFFVDEQRGWGVSPEALYRTKNGGANWEKMQVNGASLLGDVQFLNPRLGYLVAEHGGLFRTTDSGNTWLNVPNNISPAISLCFLDSLHGWVLTLSKPNYTENGGNNFTPGNSYGGLTHYIVQFVNADNGWIAGSSIWHTTNAGGAWTKILDNSSTMGDVHFFNANDGFVSHGPQVYKTNDGGQTLTRVAKLAKTLGVVEIHFTDPNHGWAVGLEKYILRYAQ